MNQSEIVKIIIETVNTIFSSFFTSIDNSIYDCLDKLVFVDSSIVSGDSISKLLGSSGKTNLIYLCNALLLGISLAYIVRYYYLNIVDANVEKPGRFFFKLLVFSIAVNSSFFVVEQFIDIFCYLSSSVQAIGKEVLGRELSFSELVIIINNDVFSKSQDFNMFSLDGIIRSFVSVEFVNLLLSYSIRYVLLQVLVLFSPFSFLSLINDSSAWIFKSWIRCFFSLLSIQFFIPLVLIVIYCTDSQNKVLLIGGIYSLTKINDYVRDLFGGIGLNISTNISNFISYIKR